MRSGCAVVPAHQLRGLLEALGVLLDHLAHLLGPGPQLVPAHDVGDEQAQRHAARRALGEELGGQRRGSAWSCRAASGPRRPPRACARSRCVEERARHLEGGRGDEAVHHLLLHARLDALLRPRARCSGGPRARRRSTSPSSTPSVFANSASTAGSFGSATWFTVTVKSRGLAAQRARRSPAGKAIGKVFSPRLGEPDERRLEVGQHAALAQHHGEVRAPCRPRRARRRSVPSKSMFTRSPTAAPRSTCSYVARCLRSVSMVESTSASRHLRSPGARPCARRASPSVISG